MAYFNYPYQNPYQNLVPSYQQNGQSIIWVSGAQEAQMYPIAPNNAVALWEKSGKTLYLKQADATGKPSMTVYDLVERVQAPQESVSQADGKVAAYATKDELEALTQQLAGLRSDVDAMRTKRVKKESADE